MKRFLIAIMLIFSYSTVFPTVGALDSTFGTAGITTTDIGVGDAAYATAIQPDGKIVVAGISAAKFTLARYNVNGSLDSTFGTAGICTDAILETGTIYAVAVQDNGKIVVAGTKGNGDFLVMRFDADGTADNSFDTDGKLAYTVGTAGAVAYAIAIQPADGKIIVAGVVDGNQIAILRINHVDGSLDTSFNTGGTGGDAPNTAGILVKTLGVATVTYAMALQDDGKIVVTGSTDTNVFVARFLADGSDYDTAGFNAGDTPGYIIQSLGGTDVAYGVGIQSTGKIVICGTTGTNAAVARFTTAGVLDTTFGVASSGYNVASTLGGTVAIAYGLQIQSNDKIVIGGTVTNASTDFVIARYLADGTLLDTSFDTDGYNVTDISGAASVDVGSAIAVQQNGKFVLAGTTTAGTANFALVRYDGDTIPQGVVDVTYKANLVTGSVTSSGFRTYPTDTTAVNKPQVKSVCNGSSTNSLLVLTENLATATKSQLVQLASDGTSTAAGSIATIDVAQIGGVDVVLDGKGRALVVGTNATPRGWIARYTIAAGAPGSFTIDSAFNSGAVLVQTASPATTSFSRVGEQTNGRIIVMGQNNGDADGILVAYNQNGSVDTTFGTSGVYTLAGKVFSDMAIGSDDGIYVIYDGATNIEIRKILADGSGLDTDYDTDGIVDTALTSANYGSARIAFDNNGKIVLGAVSTVTGNVDFQRYTTAGAANGTLTIAQATHNLSTPILKQVQCDTNNQVLFSGYDANNLIVGRLNNSLVLDTTFAPNSSTPGFLKAMYNDINPTDFIDGASGTTPHRVVNAIAIAASGNILFGGYENISATETISLVGRIVGDTTPFTQIARFPGSDVGQVDTTFGTNGEMSLASTFATAGDTPTAMYVYDSGALAGKILVAVKSGSDTKIARFNDDYTLDTTGFNAAAGFGGAAGIMVFSSLPDPTAINVDLDGTILLSSGAGGSGTNLGTLKNIASNGSAVNWTTTGTALLDKAVGVLEQSTSRIILYGAEDGVGTLVAINPVDGTVDAFFGNNGRFNSSLGSLVASSAIDSNNNILVAYRSGTDVVVKRILPNGYALDGTFTTITLTPAGGFTVDADIRLAVDKDQKIIVVARNSIGNFIAQRYATAGTADVGPVTITLANPGTSIFDSILSLSSSDSIVNGSTLILGYDSTGPNVVLARLTPAFALDSSFATSGLLETTVQTMDTFKVFDVTSDAGIIVTGHDSVTDKPAFTRIVGDHVVTKVELDSTAEVQPGILDPTFGTAGVVNLSTDLTTDFATPSRAKSIVNLSDGSYFVAADNGAHTYITKFYGPSANLDDTQVPTFGTAGVVTISGLFDVADMFIDQDGALLVCGGAGVSGSEDGWVKRYNATTGAVDATFAVAAADSLDECTMVRQQRSGRIIVSGKKDNVGKLIAYNSITGAVDVSFGSSGYYSTGVATTINSMKIDASDSIYFIANDGSSNATTYKVNGEGTTLTWTGDTTVGNSSVNSNSHIILDQSGLPVIIAVDTTTPKIVMKRFNATTGAQTVSLDITTAGLVNAGPVVTSIVVDNDGKIIFTGNNGTTTTFVVRVLAALTGLDNAGGDSFNTTGIQGYTIETTRAATWHDLVITQEGKIDVVGYVNVGGTTETPYLMRVFGDEFIPQFITSATEGTPGTLDTNYNSSGTVPGTLNLGALNTYLLDTSAKAVLALDNGKHYIAFTDPTHTVSQLVRLTQTNILDTTFQTDGIADSGAPEGVHAMFIDGQGSIVLTGTDPVASLGWIKRYLSTGAVDTTFDTDGVVYFPASTVVTVAVEQSLRRLVVAGKNGNGVLRAYQPDGTLDTTFNSLGSTPGEYSTGYPYGIWALACDQYDRLLIAYQKDGTDVDLARLNSNGVLDTSFGTNGIVSAVITGIDNETEIRVALDSSGNIIVASHFNDGANKVGIRSYSSTGISNYAQLNITTLTNAELTDLQTTEDGKVLVVGYQSGNNAMWVARVTSGGALDTTFGGGDGIMTFTVAAAAQTSRVLHALSVRYDGRLSLVGQETTGGVKTPFIARAYNEPYQDEVTQSPNSDAIGTRDITFGATSDADDRVSFFAYPATGAAQAQIARSVALQGNNKIFVALDGQDTTNTQSRVFINAFDIDGILDTSFSTDGQVEVPHVYANEYVRDMIVFSQDSVWKAIVAGYATSGAPLSATGSWLMQYNLTTPGVDTTFGGLFSDGSGTAFGDIKELHTVGRQSTGRIITGGLNFDGTTGMLLGYSSIGRLDKSFGTEGYYTSDSTKGIYAQVIDSSDRVIIAYRDGSDRVAVSRIKADGSGLDTTFGTAGTVAIADRITGLTSDTNIRVAIDQNGKIVVVAVNNTGIDYAFKRYTTAGVLDVSFATTGLLGGVTVASIGRLLIDTDGKPVVVGAVTDGSGKWMIVVRLTATLSGLDTTTFNTDGTDGYLKYKIDSTKTTSRQATSGVIHNDGRIIGVGYED